MLCRPYPLAKGGETVFYIGFRLGSFVSALGYFSHIHVLGGGVFAEGAVGLFVYISAGKALLIGYFGLNNRVDNDRKGSFAVAYPLFAWNKRQDIFVLFLP